MKEQHFGCGDALLGSNWTIRVLEKGTSFMSGLRYFRYLKDKSSSAGRERFTNCSQSNVLMQNVEGFGLFFFLQRGISIPAKDVSSLPVETVTSAMSKQRHDSTNDGNGNAILSGNVKYPSIYSIDAEILLKLM